jgi:hypothetical protein
MTAGHGYPGSGGQTGLLRAADADRDRVAGVLNTAYVEGRLSKDEYDDRLHGALSARTYADLDQLVADLPGARAAVVPQIEPAVMPVPETNGLAVASLACGLAQFVFGPLATIPAIAFGHAARRQIRRTGAKGDGLAVAGLVLGWGAVILGIIVALIVVAAFASMHGAPATGPPAPAPP